MRRKPDHLQATEFAPSGDAGLSEAATAMASRAWLRRAVRLGLGLAAAGFALSSCAEIPTASDATAQQLAELRANLEEENVLVQYQKKKKEQATREGLDADALYDNAAPLREEPGFKDNWARARKSVMEAKKSEYLKRPAKVIEACIVVAGKTKRAEDVDNCVATTQPDETLDPVRAALVIILAIVGGVAVIMGYRSTRRRIDAVAQAGQKLGLAVLQGRESTVVTGTYKEFAIKIESSPPEAGQDDRFLRVLIQSKIDGHTIVRFGPLAPPTGLDLPDLDAPEVQDSRLPEGYKLRLSPGASAEELLSGDVGFQMRVFDPIDIRVHDGVCGVTCWQVPQTADKVVEFLDLAVGCAKLYPAK